MNDVTYFKDDLSLQVSEYAFYSSCNKNAKNYIAKTDLRLRRVSWVPISLHRES
jgi:hypothetical protein